MTGLPLAQRAGRRLGLVILSIAAAAAIARPAHAEDNRREPSVLVVYDGANQDANPGRLDAFYLGNLLGHFTTNRKIIPVETYTPGMLSGYDAVFAIIYQKSVTIPDAFLKDAAVSTRTFCWVSNQIGQLDRFGGLKNRGLKFERFYQDAPLTFVKYKGAVLDKGDPDTNILTILDPARVQVIAEATGNKGLSAPYIVHSGTFWAVADSPFSYSGEADRLLAFADVLHDILGVNHPESHRAMVRIEDINPLSEPDQIRAMVSVMKAHHAPFSLGLVPVYVNGHERSYVRISERPKLVAALKEAVEAGGSPLLHGYTHQYRGVTTDDYEFWDDLTDRAVRGDSEEFAQRRIYEGIRELASVGLFPLTWETPHYAASPADYRAIKKIFNTVYERRLTTNHIGSDEFFPYPVTDLYGQFVIPESLGYIPLSNPSAATLLRNAKAALVVRDGYASGFLHPFLKPGILDDLLTGLERMGYQFQDLRSFPNRVHGDAVFISNVDGSAELHGEGRFLHTRTLSADGKWSRLSTKSIPADEPVTVRSESKPGETFVAFRNSQREPTAWESVWWFAKGDIENVHRRFESLLSPPSAEQIQPIRLLWNSKAKGPEAVDQESFFNLLTHLGLEVEKKEVSEFAIGDLHAESVLVVPAASAQTLSDEVADSILQTLDRGLLLITDGESALSRGVGLTLRHDVPIVTLFDHQFPSQIVRWPDNPAVSVVEAPPEDATVYYSDQDRRNALVLSEERGQGRYLFFAPLFDSLSGFGYARFPSIPYVLLNELQIRPWLRRPASEAYFDPGYRQNVSIERLAQLWKRSGIRVIHAAAWHFYDKYSYDYARLIKVAHENGILVYAWFEWPHVSQRFWNQHPEWRQKNGYLADAKVDWRYLMNFRDPKCFAAVMKDTEGLMTKYDWDGINLAEFHFESIGPQDKSRFTPFDPLSRAAFKKKSGFDPVELLDEHAAHYWKTDPAGLQAFWEFRRGSNATLLQSVLTEIQKMNGKASPTRETILTIIDPLEHPEYTDLLGFDLQRTIDIANKTDSTLQVEDPGVEWSKAPKRYETLAARYAKFHLKRPFMVDINVLPVHPDNQIGYPTSQPTGAEIVELWRAAASQGSRVALYSEWSLGETDWDLLPYAMAEDATVQRDGDGWLIRSPRTVEFEVGPTNHRWTLDGRPWPCYRRDVVWIPPGEHRLEISKRHDEWIDTSGIEAHLLDITGELLSADTDKSVIALEYTSRERCLLRFNKRPYWMTLDGSLTKLETTSLGEEYTVVAPPGEHRLRVNTGPSFYYFVQFFSAVSGSLIVLFGVFSSGLLFVLFVLIRVTRRLRVMRERLTRGRRPAPEPEPVQ